MKIAIHNTKNSFSENWVSYCEKLKIPFKLVNCYDYTIINELEDCDALMWHHSQNNPNDLLIAKPILYALEQSGLIVFPDFNTNWHFDDKLGQKYLLEAINAPVVASYTFFDQTKAKDWLMNSKYPLVFKLRGGAGSFNVSLVKNYSKATSIVRKAFLSGFSNFNNLSHQKEIIRKWVLNKVSIIEVVKGMARFFIKPKFSKVLGKEFGYLYFQEFIPNNEFDIRVIVIDKKAFAIKRMVRENDFRASGSGFIKYGKEEFEIETIKLAMDLTIKLKAQCIAFDFIYKNNIPLVVEISYGFAKEGYYDCEGYWDDNLIFHPGKFDPCEWMVDLVIKQLKNKNEQ